jgi:hypothetical protein
LAIFEFLYWLEFPVGRQLSESADSFYSFDNRGSYRMGRLQERATEAAGPPTFAVKCGFIHRMGIAHVPIHVNGEFIIGKTCLLILNTALAGWLHFQNPFSAGLRRGLIKVMQ